MADKNDIFVLARRREDGVEMVLGRKLINLQPHVFEEISRTPAKIGIKEVKEKIVKLEDDDAEITMDFNTADFDEYDGKTLTTVEAYRTALDGMGVAYKKTHGLPGLRKLFTENKE